MLENELCRMYNMSPPPQPWKLHVWAQLMKAYEKVFKHFRKVVPNTKYFLSFVNANKDALPKMVNPNTEKHPFKIRN